MSLLDHKIKTVRVTGRQLQVGLADGREIRLPLSLYPTLAEAGVAVRAKWELCGAGTGVEWPLLNYHLSAAGLLRGEPEAPGIAKAKKGHRYPAPKPAGALALAEEPPALAPVATNVSPRHGSLKGRAVPRPPKAAR